MELRVNSACNTIKGLESQQKQKEEIIKSQENELSKKQKIIDTLQKNRETISNIQKNAQQQYNMAMSLRKKEVEMN